MKSIILISVLGALILAPSASAAVLTGKESSGNIFIWGLKSNQTLDVDYAALPATITAIANECGLITLPRLGNFAKVRLENNPEIVVGSLPRGEANCVNGELTNKVNKAFKTAAGEVIFSGLTKFARYSVDLPDVPASRAVRANGCGIVKLTSNHKFDPSAGPIILKETNGKPIKVMEISNLLSLQGTPPCETRVDWPTSRILGSFNQEA